jgi:CheY-like chemotaxis protein
MSERRCKVLILDWDQETLISLQHVLEDAGVDTTITWDEGEAQKLIKGESFDLLLIADHDTEFSAETILHDLNSNISCPCLLLRERSLGSAQGRQLGITEVVPKRDPFRVLEQVRRHWQARQPNTHPTFART